MTSKNKTSLYRDAFLASLFTFIVLYALKIIFFNTHYLDPIAKALEDFKFTDLYYSKLQKEKNDVNKDIVLVNIGDADRNAIARQIITIKKFNPAVIGLDATFVEARDSASDYHLGQQFKSTPNLVSVGQILYDDRGKYFLASHKYFEAAATGYGNFVGEEKQTVRYFMPSIEMDGKEVSSFASLILKQYSPDKYEKLVNRKKKVEIIHYSKEHFLKFDVDDIREDNSQLAVMEGKIVLMGYLGNKLGDLYLEDLHLTPLNTSFGGHSIPDMYGVEIHANILSMGIAESYINEIPGFVNFIISFIITFLHMCVFIYLYVKKHIWFHLIAKIIQLVSFGALVFIALLFYHYFHLKAEPSLLLVAVVLSVDLLYFYDGIVKWCNERFGYQTYFMEGH